MTSIGMKIHALRKCKGITQAQLAEVLSVTAQSVSKWENEITVPDISILPVIARYFGISMDELFGYRMDALNEKERFIRFMADNGVLQFGEFELQCGRVSPYYINTGNYASAGQISKLGEFYARCMRDHNVDVSLLAANGQREIPIMMATGMAMYNRYGVDMDYSIAGNVGKRVEPDDKLVLIKDTLTSGNTLRANLEKLRDGAGHHVSHVIVSVDRMERGNHSPLTALHEIENACDVKIHAIVTVDDIIRALENRVIGGMEHLEAICRYRERYGGF